MITRRASATVRAVLALMMLGIVTPCHTGSSAGDTALAKSTAPVKSKRPASGKPRPAAVAPVTFTVENRSGKSLRTAIVQGGIPFAPGVLRDTAGLAVRDAGGKSLPAQTRSLAFWEDGSTRWLLLTAKIAELSPAAKPSFTVAAGTPPARETATAPATLPAGVVFTLVDDRGTAPFNGASGTVVETGPVMVETHVAGAFRGRERATRASVTVAGFPGSGMVRYRFSFKQLSNGAVFRKLSVVIPHPHASVWQQREMGASVRASRNTCEIVLIDADTPVDRGVGRTWEVWGFDAPTPSPARPLRPVTDPAYVIGTGAVGRIAASVPARWQETFDRSLDAVFKKRDADPRNSGWNHYGDFFDREHGLAYYGYLNQEYDPSTALWLAYARTGRPDYFDRAESLADFFADMCLSPDGATYQHRATVHAAYSVVVRAISSNLATKIKSAPGYAATPDGLTKGIASVYGEKTAGKSRKILDQMPASEPFDTRQQKLLDQLANSVQKSEEEKMRKKMERRTQQEVDRLTLRDIMHYYARSEDLKALGYGDADKAFAPFFRRYGGDWDRFPAFHVDLLPDPTRAHTGSHSLLEMLVWAYVMTGNEAYRESAMRAIRYHVDVLVPYVIETYGANRERVESRNLGWPLINMMAAWDLTEHRDPELNRDVRRVAAGLARELTEVPAGQHQGGVHAGVTLEALCRYHEKTGDEACARYIPELARYWANNQWSPARNAFNNIAGDPGSADAGITGLLLYGLAYADELAPDAGLDAAIARAVKSLESEPTNYAKRLAQLYRSTPRAFALTDRRSN